MEKTTQAAMFTAQAIAKQAVIATGAAYAMVHVRVVENCAHPSTLVYCIEMEKTGDTFHLECATTTLEELTEELAGHVAASIEIGDYPL